MHTQQWAIEVSEDRKRWDRLEPLFSSQRLARAFCKLRIPKGIHSRAVPVLSPLKLDLETVSPLLSRR